MTAEFLVFTTSRFDRELKKLFAHHPELPEHYRDVLAVLKQDPITVHGAISSRNSTARRPMMANTASGRDRFRFRYDILGHSVYELPELSPFK